MLNFCWTRVFLYHPIYLSRLIREPGMEVTPFAIFDTWSRIPAAMQQIGLRE